MSLSLLSWQRGAVTSHDAELHDKMLTSTDVLCELHNLKKLKYYCVTNDNYIAPRKRKVFTAYIGGEWERRWQYGLDTGSIYPEEITDVDIISITPKVTTIRLLQKKRIIKDMRLFRGRYIGYNITIIDRLQRNPHVKNVARLLLYLNDLPSEMQEIVLRYFLKFSNIVQ